MEALAELRDHVLVRWCIAVATEQTHLSLVTAVLVVAQQVKTAQAMPPVQMLAAAETLALVAQAELLARATPLLALVGTALNLVLFMVLAVAVVLVATLHQTTMAEQVASMALAVAALRAAEVWVVLVSRA